MKFLPQNYDKIVFLLLALLCLTPLISPPVALLLGVISTLVLGQPFREIRQKSTGLLLQISVVGLGFGMNVESAVEAGKEGIIFTIISIFGTLVLGYFIGRFFKIERNLSLLISGGTAICGGSAIAALAPVLKADEKQISVALGVVFVLNAAALFIFPWLGELLNLSQSDFGLWCAIAIHDTSSVVGAAAKFGDEALQIATTIKLARALWIIPVSFLAALIFKTKDSKIKIPYFIGFFVLAVLANTYLPFLNAIAPAIVTASKAGLTLTLFLIGAGLSKQLLQTVGIKPVTQGVILWFVISAATLSVILLH